MRIIRELAILMFAFAPLIVNVVGYYEAVKTRGLLTRNVVVGCWSAMTIFALLFALPFILWSTQ